MSNLHDLAHACAPEPQEALRSCAEALCTELRATFCDDVDCFAYQLEVKLFGSIHNNTHLAGSDADIAVIPTSCRSDLRPAKGPGPEVVCDVLKFREHLCQHLQRRFGSRFVCQQRKAILLCGSAQRMQADIVVLLPKLWQHDRSQYSHGYEIRSLCEAERMIATWPEQHHANGTAFDQRTGGRYKQAVRAAKGLLKSGAGRLADVANCIPPVLVENLFARVPTECYHHTDSCPYNIVKHLLGTLQRDFQDGTACRYRELSDKRGLFDPVQTWTYEQIRTSVEQFRRSLGT